MPQERKKTTEGGGSGAEHLVILAVDFFQEFRIGLESLPGTVATVGLGEREGGGCNTSSHLIRHFVD